MRLEASKLNESVCYSLFQYLGRNKVKLKSLLKLKQSSVYYICSVGNVLEHISI